MISLIYTADTRPGWRDTKTFIGSHPENHLKGCRHEDFLIQGPAAWLDYFRGEDVELHIFIDEHEKVPSWVREKLEAQVGDRLKTFEIAVSKKNCYWWNDAIYHHAMQAGTGEYVCKVDQDCIGFRSDSSDIIANYKQWLDGPHKFVCQPSALTFEAHQMRHASTRFLFCKHSTLNFPELEKLLNHKYRREKYPGQHLPCYEHVLGAEAGENGVLYPMLDCNDHIIFSWVTYRSGLIEELRRKTYEEVSALIQKWGIMGASDVIAENNE